MKLLIDTNIVLDMLLQREPFYKNAVAVMSLSKREDVQEYVSASAITDIYYIAFRQLKDKETVKGLLKKLLVIVSVAAVSEQEIMNALESEWVDFEDAVQYSVARLREMDAIITRNTKDYEHSEIPVWLPEQLLAEVQ